MHKVFVGTPCYGGLITTEYFKSCMQLVALAASSKIELQFAGNSTPRYLITNFINKKDE